MTWMTRPAVRGDGSLFIGINGPTGSGKTWSALELATGLAGNERFVVIDTEHERARMYADDFSFDHCPFSAPFSSDRYADVIGHHIAKGYKVIVVDSASHEYIGEGGMHDEHDRILEEMVKRSRREGDEWRIREALQWPAWREPKLAHKRFKQQLISLPPGHHIILCFRAEQKTAMTTVTENGKQRKEVGPKVGPTGRAGWFPICDAALPFEMTLSFLVLAEAPGSPLPIKAIPERLRPFIPLDKPLNRESGRKLAEWARGVVSSPTAKSALDETSHATGGHISQLPTDDPADRAKLIGDATRLGRNVLKLTQRAWGEVAIKHIGSADLNAPAATVATLTALVNELRERAHEKPWGSEAQQTELSA